MIGIDVHWDVQECDTRGKSKTKTSKNCARACKTPCLTVLGAWVVGQGISCIGGRWRTTSAHACAHHLRSNRSIPLMLAWCHLLLLLPSGKVGEGATDGGTRHPAESKPAAINGDTVYA